MTIAAACRFPEGVVLIADSRATWKVGALRRFEDRLQKVLPLGPKVGLAYAGDDIRVPEAIQRHLRGRISRDPRRGHAEQIVRVLPRIARRCYREYVRITKHKPPVSLIVVGVTGGGEVLLYAFEAPEFEARVPPDDYVVVGSGARVADYLAESMRNVDRSERSDLKTRADRLLPGLQDALRLINEATVGGMLQIVLADAMGIRPYTYWHIDLDPDQLPESKRMEMKAGTWKQTNLAKGQTIELVGPRRLILERAAPVRFQDFAPVPLAQQSPKWHPVYFLTCSRAELSPGLARFEGVMSAVLLAGYPARLQFVAALGVWGTDGAHRFRMVLESSEPDIIVADGVITFRHFPEVQDFIFEAAMEVPRAGPTFLACYIEEQRVARRALWFGESALEDRSPDAVAAELRRQQRQWLDTDLEVQGGAEVAYFSLCQGGRFEELSLSFEGEFLAVYSREYPTTVRAYAALGLRLAVGEHMIRLEVVHAASGATHVVTNTKVVSSSGIKVSQVHGDIPLRFTEPGPHYVSVRVDGRRVTSVVVHADNPDAPQSYRLRATDVLKPGETFVLLRRSLEAPPMDKEDPAGRVSDEAGHD